MNKLSYIRSLGIISILAFVTVSCFKPNDSVYLDELDVTLTYYDKDYNFQKNVTFSVRDSVGLISNYLTDQQEEDFYKPGGTSDNIREYIKQQFLDQGYMYVGENDDPDFYVNLVVAFIDNTTIVSYPPGWWWGYYPYYSYYYYYWYPWYSYPWYYEVYQYKTGSLIMEQVDAVSLETYRQWAEGKTQEEIENADPSEVPAVEISWQALINGVAGSSADYNLDRAERGVQEAFDQSPYLKKN